MGNGCVLECPIGCANKHTLCCLEYECCCNPASECLCCGCLGCRCTDCTIRCKAEQQVCCCVAGSAIPCDEEVPFMVSCCFLHCYPRVGCCMRMASLIGSAEDS